MRLLSALTDGRDVDAEAEEWAAAAAATEPLEEDEAAPDAPEEEAEEVGELEVPARHEYLPKSECDALEREHGVRIEVCDAIPGCDMRTVRLRGGAGPIADAEASVWATVARFHRSLERSLAPERPPWLRWLHHQLQLATLSNLLECPARWQCVRQ